MKGTLALAGLALAAAARPSGLLWSNILNDPGDLLTSGDAWSATRAEDIQSYRIAADDVAFTTRVRVDRIDYFTFQVGDPVILGADYYLYAFDNGSPGALIRGEHDLPLDHYNTGLFNTVVQEPVYGNSFRPTGLDIEPGQYFLAFRTVESRIGGQKNAVFTTRVALGSARAQWNFNVSVDGTVNQGWVGMHVFNGVQDQEWSFKVYGRQVVAPHLSTIVLGRRTAGDTSSLARRDNNALRVCKFVVPNQQVAPVNVEFVGTAAVSSCTGLALSVTSRMVDSGLFSQTLELFNWNTGTWDATDTRTDAVGTAFTTRELGATGNLSRLLRSSDRALRGRYLIRQTGPSSAILWCHETDEAVWLVTP